MLSPKENQVTADAYAVTPSDKVVMKFLVEVGVSKMHNDNKFCAVGIKGVEDFKITTYFNNNHLEVTRTRFINQRDHFMKLEFYEKGPILRG